MNNARQYDVILYGATGFTGQLVAEFLDENPQHGISWALAGRNLSKLQKVAQSLANNPALSCIAAEADHLDELKNLASQTKVVISTVGPYAKLGSKLVEACATTGTHYCDLTGEIPWLKEMIAKWSEVAQSNKARLVHCCGFDALPSDIGVLSLQQHALNAHGNYCERITSGLIGARGGFSGGTVASLVAMLEQAKTNKDLRKTLKNPYSLGPAAEVELPQQADLNKVVYDADFGWVCPFLMAPVNTRVVRRSHALLGLPYGRSFRYEEVVACGKGATAYLKALGNLAALGALMAGVSFKMSRLLLQKTILPSPGQGPSRALIESGFFKFRMRGLGQKADSSPFMVECEISANRDPGYGATARMLAIAAILLAKDDLDAPDAYGSLTPASSMGLKLVEPLKKAGISFEARHKTS